MADLFEMIMIVLFGVSWPINCIKLWRSRTAKGASPIFYVLILAGYLFGIGSKFLKRHGGLSTPAYVWFFYFFNLVMVAVCLMIYFRNRKLDRLQAEQAA